MLFGIADFIIFIAVALFVVVAVGALFLRHGRKQLSRGNIFGGLLSITVGVAAFVAVAKFFF